MKDESVKRAFSRSLYELLRTKRIDDVRVREICEGCGMSKRTFYNHFRDKYELGAYLYNSISTDELSGLLSQDYFMAMESGDSRMNLTDETSVEVIRRLFRAWACKNHEMSQNQAASDDINSLMPTLERVHSAGRQKVIQQRLTAEGLSLDDTDLSLAAEITYLIFLRYCDKWRPLYGQELPEAEARRVSQLTRDMIDFWVAHGEPRSDR